jgi:phytoene desaturase
MNKKTAIIGSGFSGLSAAVALASQGMEVEVFEKNEKAGGRARNFSADGFTFDMGPTWYWMPDIFESFFKKYGHTVSDFYELKRIDPSYRMFFGKDDFFDVPANLDEIYNLFDSIEPGSSKNLRKFLKDAEFKYNIGINEVIHKPSKSIFEFMEPKLLSGLFRLDFFRSISSYVSENFSNFKLQKLLEFPVLFLGATPQKTPALYSLMNYADIVLGTWHPMGGMYKVVEGMQQLAESFGVKFYFNAPVNKINVNNGKVNHVLVNEKQHTSDYLVASGDYNHIEQSLMDTEYRNYSKNYWETREMAPSALLFYIGLNKKVKNLLHHNLFFDTDFAKHAKEIYEHPRWPNDPALYVSCSSKTDPAAAPEGYENLIVLIPVAPGLTDTSEIKEKYFNIAIERIEKIIGESLRDNIIFKRFYAQSDFIADYNSFRGNAYGLANTLRQTAFLKPKMHNRKVKNLFYAGQLTTPGPGVPPTIVSGQVAAQQILRDTGTYKQKKSLKNERVVRHSIA